jgi:hypothetical protein
VIGGGKFGEFLARNRPECTGANEVSDLAAHPASVRFGRTFVHVKREEYVAEYLLGIGDIGIQRGVRDTRDSVGPARRLRSRNSATSM